MEKDTLKSNLKIYSITKVASGDVGQFLLLEHSRASSRCAFHSKQFLPTSLYDPKFKISGWNLSYCPSTLDTAKKYTFFFFKDKADYQF